MADSALSSGCYGLIEAGGTKFVLGLADGQGTLLARHRLPTTTPAETLGACIDWLRAQQRPLRAIGIASFGPLDRDPASPRWGHITATPKPHWSDTDLATPFRQAFACPLAVDTDVNGAALAEARWGAGQGHRSLLYLTVGTGVGGGYVADGRLLGGLSHPEMGHIRLPRHPDDTGFAGHCPFHGDCLEGLVSGPAIIARWGASLSDLPTGHPGIAMIGWYLGQAITGFQAIMAPARIVLGGGVMETPGLIEQVRAAAIASGGGYFPGDLQAIVAPPALGDRAGLLGALALALAETAVPMA